MCPYLQQNLSMLCWQTWPGKSRGCETYYEQCTPTKLYGDNNGAIAIAQNPQYPKRTKHFDTRNHYIRQNVKEKEIEIEYYPTSKMTADIFTKALPKPKFQLHRTEQGFPASA